MDQSLARAIYSREKVVVLDSVLNGLDATTEKGVIETVFGRRGLLRAANTTVILATNSGMIPMLPSGHNANR